MRGVEVAKAAELWNKGMSVKQIATQLNAKESWVVYHVSHHRDMFPRRNTPRVTQREREVMSDFRASGMTCKEIARLMGVSEKTVSRYTRGESSGAD